MSADSSSLVGQVNLSDMPDRAGIFGRLPSKEGGVQARQRLTGGQHYYCIYVLLPQFLNAGRPRFGVVDVDELNVVYRAGTVVLRNDQVVFGAEFAVAPR